MESQGESICLFLCGDVMTGRGIDQVLPHPSEPTLYEPYVRDAREYVALAEATSGPIPRPVDYGYVWGDALDELARNAPALRIANLETAVTGSATPWPKGINYRMDPENVSCLAAAGLDCCVMANNHVLDWGYEGLAETIVALRAAGIAVAGAGGDHDEAAAPAVLPEHGGGRVLVFSFAFADSGVPPDWGATSTRPGVWLADFSGATVDEIRRRCEAIKRPGDLAIASIHWGGNWGYEVEAEHIRFAHRLIDEAPIDLIHGHSSHHPRPAEVYRDKLILYGCGDFLNDYEGIHGYEPFRGDLSLMYLPVLERAGGRLLRLRMVPFQMRRFRLNRASAVDARWIEQTLNRVGAPFGRRIVREGKRGPLVLRPLEEGHLTVR